MFDQFTVSSVVYLAFAMNDGVGIVDKSGNWFGVWRDSNNFRKQLKTVTAESLKIGTVSGLSIVR